jgi:hypothetical protein
MIMMKDAWQQQHNNNKHNKYVRERQGVGAYNAPTETIKNEIEEGAKSNEAHLAVRIRLPIPVSFPWSCQP